MIKKLLKKNVKKLIALCLWIMHLNVFAQTIKITGSVTSDNSTETLPGVSVVIKGTKIGTVTDLDGHYTINASKNATLLFSYVGYKTLSQPVNGRKEVNIKLISESSSLNEIVVVGYGSQKKREITGAIGQIKSEDINRLATGNFQEALQGQISGVNVVNSGTPGEESQVIIRGVSSVINIAGANQPLYVVDGIPFQGAPNLNPNEIESIEVLKDAASAAIYGTRASNGVILITTKKGKPGELKVQFDSYYGIQNRTQGIQLANAYEQMYIYRIAAMNNNGTFNTGSPSGNSGGDPTNVEQFTFTLANSGINYDTNWLDVFTHNNAPVQNYNLLVSGGSQNLTYSITGNYFNQDGVVINSRANRASLRANTSFKKGKFDMNSSINLQRRNNGSANASLFQSAFRLDPFRKAPNFASDLIESANTAASGSEGGLDVLATQVKQQNANLGYEVFGAIYPKFNITKDLQIGANLGGDYVQNQITNFQPSFSITSPETGDVKPTKYVSQLVEGRNGSFKFTSEFIANFKKTIGQHTFGVTALYSRETYNLNNTSSTVRDFLTNTTPTLSAGTTIYAVSGTKETENLIGKLLRLQYNYKERYNFSGSIRQDGSSNFGPDHRYALFPSAAFAYNISEEPFFKALDKKNLFTSAKIRLSYGQVGNQRIPRYVYQSIVDPNIDYIYGLYGSGDQGILAPGVATRGIANEDVKWEVATNKNLGFDLEFKNNLTFSFDIYNKRSNDLLFPVIVPASNGTNIGNVNGVNYSTVIKNIGDITNNGIELSASYRTNINKIALRFSGTFTRNRNMVVRMATPTDVIKGGVPQGNTSEYTSVIKVGYPVGSFFLIPTKGVIKTGADLAEANKTQGNLASQLGDLWYVDTNGDGQIDDNDRTYQGSSSPSWEAGFNTSISYKGFSLDINLYGVYGSKLFNGARYGAYGAGGNGIPRAKEALYMWSPENPDSNIPAESGGTDRRNNARSWDDYFLEDGSYLRVRNLTLRYSLPAKLLKSIGASSISVYVNAQNPFTLTNYTGFDPEVSGSLLDRGVDRINFPVTRQFRFGLSCGF